MIRLNSLANDEDSAEGGVKAHDPQKMFVNRTSVMFFIFKHCDSQYLKQKL